MTILVILESPAKAPKIEKILKSLGHDVIVKASYGHISDLDKKSLSIDVNNNFKPIYKMSLDKRNVISELKKAYQKCDKQIFLASDFDREGEAIAWHISEQLKIPKDNRKRLLFTEITKTALKNAIENPKMLDMNMFYAQQCRRIIDRLIGWLITPLLWKYIQNSMKKGISLSAGRVQSVANKLIIEREEEIEKFSTDSYFKTYGKFEYNKHKIDGELVQKIENKDKTYDFLELCANSDFKIGDIKKTNSKKSSPAPFTTSTIQQEASNKFRIGPKKLMMILQKLYEGGFITYMRTDSTIISEDILNDIEQMVLKEYGKPYSSKKQYKKKSKNSQEAHEAIRPTDISLQQLEEYDADQCKLYNLIWKRTIASQMSDTKLENISIFIDIYVEDEKTKEYQFITKTQKIVFDGFQKLYKPFEENDEDNSIKSPTLFNIDFKTDTILTMKSISSIEKYTKPKHLRFTEASLIKKLDELGIGRPSTYSSMVSTVQDRKYVELKDKEGIMKNISILKLKGDTIEEKNEKVNINGEKNKLIPTNIGRIVNTFLKEHFNTILDYNFTAKIEKHLDQISNGEKNWINVVKDVYHSFNDTVVKLNTSSLDKSKYSRLLGIDPKTKFEISTYIAKYGPVVQLKNNMNPKKSKFSPLKDIKMEEVTLDQALELLKYPYIYGKYLKKEVTVCKGKFGVYLKYDNKNVSLNGVKEEQINDEVIKNLLDTSQNTNVSSIIKKVNTDIIIKNGKFGPYINYKNKHNIKIYSKKKLEELTVEDCMQLISLKFNKKK